MTKECKLCKPQFVIVDTDMYEQLVSIVRVNGAERIRELINMIDQDYDGERS